MQSRLNNSTSIAILVVVLLIAAIFVWRSQAPPGDPTGGKGIPRTDGLSDNQREGMVIMNKAPRPDQAATNR